MKKSPLKNGGIKGKKMSRLNRRNKDSVMGDDFWHIETFAEMVGFTVREAVEHVWKNNIRTKSTRGGMWVSSKAFDGLEIKKTLGEL